MAQSKQVRVNAILLAAVLLAGGCAVIFTETLHHVLGFNAWVFTAFAAVLAAVHFTTGVRTADANKRPGSAALAITSLAAAVGAAIAALTLNTPLFIVVMLTWAAIVAVIELLPQVRVANRESLVLGVLAAMLALALVFLARDLTMAVGLFSAYCILAGVYLGIGAFERSPIRSGQHAPAASENGI